MFAFNLKIAIRNIWKNKVFSSINIIGLAISVACCLVISLYVWNEWKYDTFHTNIDNIYRVTEKQNQSGTLYDVAVTPGPLAPALQKDFPEIINTVRFANWSGMLRANNQTFEEKKIKLTDNAIFDVFNFPLVKGNPATALRLPNEIVITETTAEKYFGKDWRNNSALLDQTISFNNQSNLKLVGVAKDLPANSSIQFDVLIPLSNLFLADEWSYKWNSNSYHTYLQLKPGTDMTAFSKKVLGKLASYDNGKEDKLLLQPFKKQYLYSEFAFNSDWDKRSNIKYLKIFSAIGLLLLLIACVNFINLSTARSLKRSKEVGMRKVNGASRRQLIYQFLSESIMVAAIAGLLAVVIVVATKPFIEIYAGINFSTALTGSVIFPALLVFIILIGLVAGLYPAFILSAFSPATVLKKSAVFVSGNLLRKGLVVFQFSISVILVTSVYYMYRQLQYVQQKDLGFDKSQLLTIYLKGQLMQKAGLFKTDLQNIPGIAAVAPATVNMVNVDNSGNIVWEGQQEKDEFLIAQANISPDFIPALGMKVVSGTNFSLQKTNDTSTFIVNESAVKRMGYTNQNAIGKQLEFWGAKGPIIGVVKDFNFKPLNSAIEPFIFRYQPQDRYFNLFVKVQPGKTQQVLPKIEKIFKHYEADGAFDYSFVNEGLNNLYSNDNRTASIIFFFANLAILIGCLGLFGLTVFSAEQRIKEIGIRKVLGAGIASITTLLTKDFLKLVGISILIGAPIAWYVVSQWLQNYVYRIQLNWLPFVLIGVGVLAIALLTISIHAVKAAMANPVKNLRSE